jgi:shikimate dehydrogenase/3-dehydroquinate dehydratase type I
MTKICAVLMEETTGAIPDGAEALEFRLDLFPKMPEDFSFLKAGVPVIATFRGKEDVSLLRKALDAGADFVDIASDSALRNAFPKDRTICSCHDFEKTPDTGTILEIMSDLKTSGIPKAAFMVHGAADLLAIRDAAEVLKGEPFILIGMGEAGTITRIRAEDLGVLFHYCTPGNPTAPGQLTLQDAVRIGGQPLVLGITGWPLAHTRSPQIHNAALKSAGIMGYYVKIPANPAELGLIPEVIRKYRVAGINVTIPHKEQILPYLAETDLPARSAGAVNTIRSGGCGLVGFNTDISGLSAVLGNVEDARVLLIGAGGAGGAALACLRNQNAHVTIFSRTAARAEALGKKFCARVTDAPESGWDIIINATPAGMTGFDNISPVPDSVFSGAATVLDMVYEPEETPFLSAAKAAGVRNVRNGKELLLEQAAASFVLWTGVEPDRTVMRNAYEGKT